MMTIKTIMGAGWTVSSRLSGRVIDFLTVAVLARTLTPVDFGVVALAMTLIVIIDTIMEVPLIQALTRLSTLRRSHLDTAFTLGLLRGGSLFLVVLAAAWPFSAIYHSPTLFPLIALAAFGPVARSLYNPRMAEFVRELNFRPLFITDFSGKVVASVTAICAVHFGAGYWAIAASSVATPSASALISYFLVPYRPRLSFAEFRDFSSFLGWLSIAQIASSVSWQFDRVLLGYFFSKAVLGQYTMASDLSVLPTQSLIGPAMQPVMAAFSRINEDRARLRNAYLKASRLTMMLAAPACVGISLTSDIIVRVLLGPKWPEAAIYLQWLALTTLLAAFYQPVYSLALATNRTSIVCRFGVMELCCRIVLMSLGLYFFSLPGVIAARGVVSAIVFVLSLNASRRLTGVARASEIRNLWEVAAASAVMACLVLALRHELGEINLGMIVELVMLVATGAAVYLTTLLLLGVRLSSYLRAAV